MDLRRHFFGMMLLTSLLALTSACTQEQDGVSIQSNPAHTTVRYLDDIEWKQRTEFGRAYSDWSFLCTSKVKLRRLKDESPQGTYVFQIKGVNVVLGLEMFQTLPYGVKNPLRKHEEMHCTMTAECYKDAAKTAKEIAQGLIGKKITINKVQDEATAEKFAVIEAKKLFNTKYKEQTSIKADKLAVIFDRITNHGLNGVSNEDGRLRSLDEFNQPEKAGVKSDVQGVQPKL